MDRSLFECHRTGDAETEPLVTRRSLLAGAGSLALMATAHPSRAETPPLSDSTRREMTMDIKRNGSQPSAKGPADYFTGAVRIDAPFKTTAPARVSGAT